MTRWKQAYDLLQTVTPLPWDCGRLCGKRCCRPTGDHTGAVPLLPGEEVILRHLEPNDWFYLSPHPDGGYLLYCQGSCRRQHRPFVCRSFPLTAYLDAGGFLHVDFDKRGLAICPLIKPGRSKHLILQPSFIRRVRRAWTILCEEPAIARYISRNPRPAHPGYRSGPLQPGQTTQDP